MKAKYLLLVFVVAICTNVNAQYSKKRPVYKLGFEAGPSLIKLKGNDYLDANYKSTLGFAAGFSFQVLIPKSSCSFKTNIFYERKGAISDDILFTNSLGHVTSTTHNSISLTYITIPAMLHLRTKGRIGLFVNAGAYAGFLLKDEATNGARDTLPELITDNTANDNKLDGGFCLGVGLEIPIQEKFTFSLEVRDNIGSYDINNAAHSRGGTVKTNAINLLVGVSYRITDPYRRKRK